MEVYWVKQKGFKLKQNKKMVTYSRAIVINKIMVGYYTIDKFTTLFNFYLIP